MNIGEIYELAQVVADYGASELKLHQLRMVGNAADNPELAVPDGDARLEMLKSHIEGSDWPLHVVYDADVVGGPSGKPVSAAEGLDIERIELDPEFGLTMSCKAVGRNAHSFVWDPLKMRVEHRRSSLSEEVLGIRQVNYVG